MNANAIGVAVIFALYVLLPAYIAAKSLRRKSDD